MRVDRLRVLSDRLKKGEAGRGISTEVGAILDLPHTAWREFTESVDAALALIPAGCWWRVDQESNCQAEIWAAMADCQIRVHAPTPALALCAARIEYEILKEAPQP